jgi:hypothetical protein
MSMLCLSEPDPRHSNARHWIMPAPLLQRGSDGNNVSFLQTWFAPMSEFLKDERGTDVAACVQGPLPSNVQAWGSRRVPNFAAVQQRSTLSFAVDGFQLLAAGGK